MKKRIISVGAVCALWACGDGATSAELEDEGEPSVIMEAIIGGTPASSTYPEAVIINMRASSGASFGCSGTLIAPKVVLTAGHCIEGMTAWEVIAGAQIRVSQRAETYDWKGNTTSQVNPKQHDIGLVYLSDAITLPSYPELAQVPASLNTRALAVGRVGTLNLANGLYHAPIVLQSGATVGHPFTYVSSTVIEHGDSGGPVFVDETHRIVAVNSGANSTIQVTARVDLLYPWIQERIKANAPSASTPDAGAPPAPKPPAAVDAGAAGGTTTCAPEMESNDTFARANAASSTQCGALQSGSDVDWFTFTLPRGTSKLTLTASGDASMVLGRVSNARCVPALTNVRVVSVSSSVSTKLCASVSSPSKKAQTYRLVR